jgi:hypothetical protein
MISRCIYTVGPRILSRHLKNVCLMTSEHEYTARAACAPAALWELLQVEAWATWNQDVRRVERLAPGRFRIMRSSGTERLCSVGRRRVRLAT